LIDRPTLLFAESLESVRNRREEVKGEGICLWLETVARAVLGELKESVKWLYARGIETHAVRHSERGDRQAEQERGEREKHRKRRKENDRTKQETTREWNSLVSAAEPVHQVDAALIL